MNGEEVYAPRRLSLAVRTLLCLGGLVVIAWVFSVAPNSRYGNIVNLAVLAACAVLIAWAAVGFALQLFDPRGLTIDNSGFSFRGIWKRQYFTWREVSAFQVVLYRTITVIGFDVIGAKQTTTRRMNRNAMGVSDFIFAHSFTGAEQQMCDKLNARRSAALGVR